MRIYYSVQDIDARHMTIYGKVEYTTDRGSDVNSCNNIDISILTDYNKIIRLKDYLVTHGPFNEMVFPNL